MTLVQEDKDFSARKCDMYSLSSYHFEVQISLKISGISVLFLWEQLMMCIGYPFHIRWFCWISIHFFFPPFFAYVNIVPFTPWHHHMSGVIRSQAEPSTGVYKGARCLRDGVIQSPLWVVQDAYDHISSAHKIVCKQYCEHKGILDSKEWALKSS